MGIPTQPSAYIGASGDTTGATDYAQISTALARLAATPTGGILQLGPGNFYTNQTIVLPLTGPGRVSITGSGVLQTNLICPVDTVIIQMGNEQADHIMRNWMLLSDMTVSQTAASQTHACVRVDGGGRGTTIRRVSTGGGKYGFELMDLDRCLFEDLSANNPTFAGIFLEVGFQNTYGTCTFINCDTVLSNNNTYGWYVNANADQPSPNAPDRMAFIGGLNFMTPGLTGCIGFYNVIAMTSTTFMGTLFEQNSTQFRSDGTHTVNFIGCTFLDATQTCVNIAYMNSSGSFTFRDCRFQQATNCFNGISGSPQVILEGRNTNQGNITNLFAGSIGSKMGTDTVFAGNDTLASGLNNQRYGYGFIDQLILNAAGNGISQGSGAPTAPNGHNPTAGDIYFRTDTPSTANQRLYICTVGGGSPTWVGIA